MKTIGLCPLFTPFLAVLVASGCSDGHRKPPSSNGDPSPALTAGAAGTDAEVGGGANAFGGGASGSSSAADAGSSAAGAGNGGSTNGGGHAGSAGGVPTFEAAECAMNKGICIEADFCVPSGGAVVGAGPGGCPAGWECCAAPQPAEDGTSCSDFGGICTTIGACTLAGGYLTADKDSCGDLPTVCCVPHSLCGDVTIDCCADYAPLYKPACVRGSLVCIFGDPRPVGTCAFVP